MNAGASAPQARDLDIILELHRKRCEAAAVTGLVPGYAPEPGGLHSKLEAQRQ